MQNDLQVKYGVCFLGIFCSPHNWRRHLHHSFDVIKHLWWYFKSLCLIVKTIIHNFIWMKTLALLVIYNFILSNIYSSAWQYNCCFNPGFQITWHTKLSTCIIFSLAIPYCKRRSQLKKFALGINKIKNLQPNKF